MRSSLWWESLNRIKLVSEFGIRIVVVTLRRKLRKVLGQQYQSVTEQAGNIGTR